MRATTVPTVMPKRSCRKELLTERAIMMQMMSVDRVMTMGE